MEGAAGRSARSAVEAAEDAPGSVGTAFAWQSPGAVAPCRRAQGRVVQSSPMGLEIDDSTSGSL